MKVIKYFLLKTGIGFNKIRELIHKPIGKNMKFSLVILGLMYFPVFSSMVIDNQTFGDGDTLFSSRGMRQNNFDLSIQKSESIFKLTDHKVIGIDLGTKNVCTVVSNVKGVFSLIENNLSKKYLKALIIASNVPENIFTVRENEYNNAKIKLDNLVAELIRNEFISESISSKIEITPVRETMMEYLRGRSSVLQPVPGYEYLTQCELKGRKIIIPIQDMITPIDTKNPTKYNKKQIFGIMIQAKQLFANEYSSKQDQLSNNGKTVDLNLTFNDQVPEKNKEIIAAIYAEVYAEEFLKGDLSKINVSYVNESDAALTAYLYENYNATLKQTTNHDKLVVLDLGQSGLRMKGLMGTDQEIQITKSKAYQNISGDLIDQAIWDVFKEKVAQEIGKSKDIHLTYEKAKNLVETNLSLKSKCLVEQKNAKEKLSAAGASDINVSIDNVYKDEGVEVEFSVKDINAALDKANLIETFKNDIKDGVKEMYGSSQKIEDIEFVIVGGSLRIHYLKKVVAELVTGKEIKDKTMISANLIQTLNMDESPAYGAGYTSLLQDNYKKIFSKTVNAEQVEQILQYVGFNYYYKPILNRLFTAHIQQTKLQRLRNEIEQTCYSVNHIIEAIEASDLSKIEKEINEIKKKQINITDTDQKKKNEERLSELGQIKKRVTDSAYWIDLHSSSGNILNNILKGNNPLKDNLEFMTTLHGRFNVDTITKHDKNNQLGVLKESLDRVEADFRDSVDLRLRATKSYNAKYQETGLVELLEDLVAKYQETELVERLEDLVENKNNDLKVLNGTLAGNYFDVCLNLFLEKLNEVNPNFSSFDIFEIILQLRQGKTFDPTIAIDVWLYAKEYFTNDTNH